jgi:membrane protein implicated in regulation of membrane protease activity
VTPAIIFTYLVSTDVLTQIAAWLPFVTLILKFFSALCGFIVSAMLLSRRVRRWLRRRRAPRK